MDNFLGRENWQPDGFISAEDERIQNYFVEQSPLTLNMFYSYRLPFYGRFVADESFGGNSYQYIPTELQIGTAVTMRNSASAGEYPLEEQPLGMSQMLQTLYDKTAQFWQRIRDAAGTGQ